MLKFSEILIQLTKSEIVCGEIDGIQLFMLFRDKCCLCLLLIMYSSKTYGTNWLANICKHFSLVFTSDMHMHKHMMMLALIEEKCLTELTQEETLCVIKYALIEKIFYGT
jgi:hypothetical protein